MLSLLADADGYDPAHGKPDASQILSDGCGYINRAGLEDIRQKLGEKHSDFGVQGRCAGAKGMFVEHPDDDSDEIKLWIPLSQLKIVYKHPLRPADLVFHLIAISRASSRQLSLSKQPLVILQHCGIQDKTIVDLLLESYAVEFQPIIDSLENPSKESVVRLIKYADEAGGVNRLKAQALSGVHARAQGLSNSRKNFEVLAPVIEEISTGNSKPDGEAEDKEEELEEAEEDFGSSGRNPITGG